MNLLIQQRLVLEVEVLRDRAPLYVLPPPCPLDVQPIDFSQAAMLIERGRADTRAFLEEIAGGTSARRASRHVERLQPHGH